MGGIVGRMFREFAITLSAAVAISMVVSLTTTPMMCAKLLKSHQKGQKHNRFYNASERGFQALYDGYASSLQWVLEHQRLVLGVAVGTVCLAVYLYIVVPKGFFPAQDTGRLNGNAIGPEDISFQSMRQKLMQYVAIVQKDPAVDIVAGFIGRPNTASLNITLKPLSERKAQRGPGGQSSAAPVGARSRRQPLLAGRAGRANRRPHRQQRIPVHLAGR